MERFDAMDYLALVERYQVSHSQLVPTMFSRMLKLPGKTELATTYHHCALRYASTLPGNGERTNDRLVGTIIHEYYSATEGLGFAACNTEEWLEHKGTVGKVVLGEPMLMTKYGHCPWAEHALWFKTATEFSCITTTQKKTAESTSSDGSMTTVGDVGYVDADGFLYLTDRKTFMIISGGVNIYPQECEDLLISHPKIEDAAVFGVPNTDLGEEVKAVVQPITGVTGDDKLTDEILGYLSEHLSRQKIPLRDYIDEMPRLPTGKLYKRLLRMVLRWTESRRLNKNYEHLLR